MCKYCDFTYVETRTGEKSNENVIINELRDGSQIFEVSMNRYRTDDGYVSNKLIFSENIDTVRDVYEVKQESIEIKYCPFCGEEL